MIRRRERESEMLMKKGELEKGGGIRCGRKGNSWKKERESELNLMKRKKRSRRE